MGILEAITVFVAAASNNAAPHPSLLATIAVIVGVVSGIAGVTLGIINCVDQRRTRRPRLVVRPRLPCPVYVHIFKDSGTILQPVKDFFAIMEVCNVGHMPVVVSHVGFLGKHRSDDELLVNTPESLNDIELPGELKPQHAAMLRFKVEDLPDSGKLGRAVAVTVVGDIFKASGRAMREFARERKAAQLRQPLPGVSYTSSPASRTPPGDTRSGGCNAGRSSPGPTSAPSG